MTRTSKPGIFQIGTVVDEITDGIRTVAISGWSLGYCMNWCACHVSPDKTFELIGDKFRGYLGLKCFHIEQCGCCEPWTSEELRQIARDFRAIEAIETVPQP